MLSLYEDKHRASADVKALANGKILEVRRKIDELRSMEATLKALAENCRGNNRPDCPILDDIAGDLGRK